MCLINEIVSNFTFMLHLLRVQFVQCVYVSSKLLSHHGYLMVFSYILKLFTNVFDVIVDLLKASLTIVDYYINNVNKVLLLK